MNNIHTISDPIISNSISPISSTAETRETDPQLLPDERIAELSPEARQELETALHHFQSDLLIALSPKPFSELIEAQKYFPKTNSQSAVMLFPTNNGWIYLWKSSESEASIHICVAPSERLFEELKQLHQHIKHPEHDPHSRFTLFNDLANHYPALTGKTTCSQFLAFWLKTFDVISAGPINEAEVVKANFTCDETTTAVVLTSKKTKIVGIKLLNLGHGSYKHFYLSPHRTSQGIPYVVSVQRTKKLKADMLKKEMENEKSITDTLKGLKPDDQSLFVLRSFFTNGNESYTLSTLCNLGTLKNVTHLDLESKLSVLSQVAKGLSILHDEWIIHCDIKPENILVSNYGNGLEAKICDFGQSLTRFRIFGESISLFITNCIPDQRINLERGAKGYLPPEIYLGQKHFSTESDLFSFGVTAFNFLFPSVKFYGGDVLNSYGSKEGCTKTLSSDKEPFLPRHLRAVKVHNKVYNGPQNIHSKLLIDLLTSLTHADLSQRGPSALESHRALAKLLEDEQAIAMIHSDLAPLLQSK